MDIFGADFASEMLLLLSKKKVMGALGQSGCLKIRKLSSVRKDCRLSTVDQLWLVASY
jgi:hypothetical protein